MYLYEQHNKHMPTVFTQKIFIVKKENINLKTVGIVAEYNPFHNGHKYQIKQIRRQTNADNIVVVMSGNFVQRGGFAWTDKNLRTQMAIECGADFVFELPTVFACASAEIFALGAVTLLDSLGFVDEICFGSEAGNLEILEKISSILNSNDYIKELELYLKEGLAFPVAREQYLKKCMPEYSNILPTLLKQPNNILGIEYIKALKKINSHIKPITIKRIDNGYHSTNLDSTTTLSDNTYNLNKNKQLQNTSKIVCCCSNSKENVYWSDKSNNKFSSASAIRTSFEKLNFFSDITEKEAALNKIIEHVPEAVINILKNNLTRFPASNSLFSDMLYFKILSLKKENLPLDIYSDVSPELSDRIYNNLHKYKDFDDFANILKTKQYTHTRITRALTHILLDIKKEDMDLFISQLCHENYNKPTKTSATNYIDTNIKTCMQPVIYARLLGMNKNKSHILRNINNIPVITKVANADKSFEKFLSQSQNDITTSKSTIITSGCENIQTSSIIDEQNSQYIKQLQKMFNYDLFATDLYRFCTGNNVPDEYRAGIYIYLT